jgi:2-hydroxy fatty acid dioxygenase
MLVSLLTATAFSYRGDGLKVAAGVHAFSWIAQFFGHGVHEKRAPALLDNLIGGRSHLNGHPQSADNQMVAVVLAPFFVHLELLFGMGYKPEMHKRITNEIGKEIAKIRKAEGDKQRAGKKEL